MKFGLIFLLWWFLALPVLAQPELLAPEQAFRPSLVKIDAHTLEARFSIAPGYYLYRERFSFESPALPLQLSYPPGRIKRDPAFGQVEIYPQSMAIRLLASHALQDGVSVTFKFQGCAEAGICYPPQTVTLQPAEFTPQSKPMALQALFGPMAEASPSPPLQEPSRPALFAGSFPATLLLFFLAGLGLAFTACMYPLLPIVSSIVLRGAQHGQRRAFGLSVVYAQGLALTYTAAGVLAAASGALLSVTLQQPWVIAGFAMFFVLMALSMFGVFSLQLPGVLQSRINDWANCLPGGRFLSVFIMGALSALIVGPCIAPPLVSVLAYLGQTGDVWLGGAALYAMAMGLGVPLLVIGMFGAAALPRLSSKVLQVVQIIFGVVLLAMAVWIARPLWQTHRAVPGLDFKNVASSAELDAAVLRSTGTPVLLDFYADWCVSCLEFERYTLTDPVVRQNLSGYTLLRADITANTPEHRALLKRFGLYGPPALLFFDQSGKLREDRVIGVPENEEFAAMLQRLR
ncbi:MAG: protein-disulfide reductase DsbD [Formivibrio sp.]|nr:protein-disulfide reductase DsbD [Formivibrio sp.]